MSDYWQQQREDAYSVGDEPAVTAPTSDSPASDEICSCRNIMGLHRYGRRCENYVERSPATSEKYLCGCGYGSDDEAVMFDHVESQHAGSAWVGEQR